MKDSGGGGGFYIIYSTHMIWYEYLVTLVLIQYILFKIQNKYNHDLDQKRSVDLVYKDYDVPPMETPEEYDSAMCIHPSVRFGLYGDEK